MKIRKFTPIVYFDLSFGCLIPTFFVIPPLVYLLAINFLITVICIASIIAIATLWIVVLKGAEEVKKEKIFCKFATTMGIIALMIQVLHFLIFDMKNGASISFFSKLTSLSKSEEVFNHSGVLFQVGMLGAFIVGLKYLLQLLKPSK